MLRRYELHNHTVESDASLTCEDLIQVMEEEKVDVFALTDHNTISGHSKVQRILAGKPHHVQCVYGMEYTTYYGHILCLNMKEYVPWNSINKHKPELLFRACRDAGAVVGIAHPFSFGDPFARGCRFEMDISDFSCLDFIEIMNNPEPLYDVNRYNLAWWENLVLEGKQLAATAGMDLHNRACFGMKFATYIEKMDDQAPEIELAEAIRSGKTWVSKGMALLWNRECDQWHFQLENEQKPGYISCSSYLMVLKTKVDEKIYEIGDSGLTLSTSQLPEGGIIIPELYQGERILDNLVCVSPVIRM